MSERVALVGGKRIKGWADSHVPTKVESRVINLAELLEEAERAKGSVQLPPGTAMYQIQHDLYTSTGQPLLSIWRELPAASAEEALQKYLWSSQELVAANGEHMAVVLKDGHRYEHQEIEVFRSD